MEDDLSDPKTIAQLECSAQFFEFTPDAFVDTLTGLATKICQENLKSAQRHIQKCFKDKVSEEELEACFEKTAERYTEATEKVFLKFGKFVKNNLLRIPDTVVLPEHKERPVAVADEADLTAAENRFARLRTALGSSRLKAAVLEGKVHRLQQVRQRQQSLLGEAREVRTASKAVNELQSKVAQVGHAREALKQVLEAAAGLKEEDRCATGKRGHDRDGEGEADRQVMAKKTKIA